MRSSPPISRDRLPALDGLRGLAALGVIFNHLGPLDTGSPWLAPLVWISLFGWTGVDLFFVLSGFLITGILVSHRRAANYFSAFYTHRALRIFPLYFVLLLVFTVIVPAAFPAQVQTMMTPGHVWPYWLFLSNLWVFNKFLFMAHVPMIAPAWSLAIEEQFYIVWSAVVRWLDPRRLAFVAAAVLIGGIVLRFGVLCAVIYYTSGDPIEKVERGLSTIFYFTLTHLDGLCIGILMRLLYDRPRFRTALARFARAWWVWAAAIAVILIADGQAGWPQIHNWYQPMMLVFGFTVLALLFAALILHGLMLNGWVRTVFDLPTLRRLGAYSYCMYLFHLPVSTLMRLVITNTIGSIGVVPLLGVEFAAVIGFAHLSYVWFESPILSLKRFTQYRRFPPHL
jgi:peptidoglycan/LPS O-acetylase OafA/YrhL